MPIGGLFQKHMAFDAVAYGALSIFANSLVEIYEPVSDENRGEWDIDKGWTEAERIPIYRGWAAITPNMDWRARDRRQGYDDDATHAYRVQLWHIDKNETVPREQWGDRSKRVSLRYGQLVKIVKHPSDPTREGMQLVIRNATTDSDWWQPTLLCDMRTGDMYGTAY